ncbi:hypothetical protein [Flavobacterium piscis]|uniref:Uncharacterized protein n=1 Tax=Flavobacterium piscis TaxID=1114874 RepID=A0ABU1YAU8_9FLAO|nr:hypothetical protein [Flavobacterium piscis]MDR7211358.1 hypothetical protein [Flavobacterium piscis]
MQDYDRETRKKKKDLLRSGNDFINLYSFAFFKDKCFYGLVLYVLASAKPKPINYFVCSYAEANKNICLKEAKEKEREITLCLI